jgi:hypothetical protein
MSRDITHPLTTAIPYRSISSIDRNQWINIEANKHCAAGKS